MITLLVHPYDDRIEHVMNFTNEVFVSLYLYVLIALTEFTGSGEEGLGPSLRVGLGWVLVGIVFASLLCNVLKLIVVIVIAVKKRIARADAKLYDT